MKNQSRYRMGYSKARGTLKETRILNEETNAIEGIVYGETRMSKAWGFQRLGEALPFSGKHSTDSRLLPL
jgi:hypothetical protein